MADFVTVTHHHGIAAVILNRSDVRNAFNAQMITEITQAFHDLGQAANVRVILLKAEGKAFCAGGDLNWMKQSVDYSREQNMEDASHLAQMFQTIYNTPKPTIARVQGDVYGGGTGLVAACDMAIALKEVSVCFSEVKLGLMPAVISPFVLRKMRAGAARRYFLTAETFTAKKAMRLGLFHEVADSEKEMDDWIYDTVVALLNNGPEALSATKSLLDRVPAMAWPEALTYCTAQIAERRVSTEGQEGIRAFLEKRPPVWRMTCEAAEACSSPSESLTAEGKHAQDKEKEKDQEKSKKEKHREAYACDVHVDEAGSA